MWNGEDRRRSTALVGHERRGKSWRAEQLKRVLLASGAQVIQDEVKDETQLYGLKLDDQTYLFVSKAKKEGPNAGK